MTRQRLVLGGMWIAATLVMVAIYLTQERPRDDPRRRVDRGAPVYDAEQGSSGGDVEASAPQATRAGDVGEFRGGRRHVAQSGLVGPASAEHVRRLETGGAVSAQVIAGPDGTLYVGSHDHNFYAFDAAGEVRWTRDLGGPIYSTAVLADGRLYVGSDSDHFFALDAGTGEVIWHLATEDDADTAVTLSPDGQTLYFGAGSELWAVGREGEVRWRFRTGLKIFSAPAVDDEGVVYVGSQDDHLYAIAPDGRMRWRYRTGDDIDSSPVVGDDGSIYFGCDDRHVYALDRRGALRWRVSVGADVRAPLALGAEGDVLVGVFSPEARLLSLDRASGEERWRFEVGTSTSRSSVSGGPLVDREGDIYFGADDDYVYALDREGQLRWTLGTDGNVDSEPAIVRDGLLAVGSDDRRVYLVGR